MKNTIILIFLITLIWGCENIEEITYVKEFSKEEKMKIAHRLSDGCLDGKYQGSVPFQFVLLEAKQLDSTFSDIYREIGVPYLKRGYVHEFNKIYTKAGDLDPEMWRGYEGYGWLYFYRDYQKAIICFDELDASTPNFVDYPQALSVHYMRGICYMQLGKFDRAESYFEKHFDHEIATTGLDYISTESFLFRAMNFVKMGKVDKGLEVIDMGLKVHDGENADMLFYKSKLIEKTNPKLAKSLLEEAKIMFDRGYAHSRPYVEEFYQLYEGDF